MPTRPLPRARALPVHDEDRKRFSVCILQLQRCAAYIRPCELSAPPPHPLARARGREMAPTRVRAICHSRWHVRAYRLLPGGGVLLSLTHAHPLTHSLTHSSHANTHSLTHTHAHTHSHSHSRATPGGESYTPLSGEYGTCKTVNARFWPGLLGKSP